MIVKNGLIFRLYVLGMMGFMFGEFLAACVLDYLGVGGVTLDLICGRLDVRLLDKLCSTPSGREFYVYSVVFSFLMIPFYMVYMFWNTRDLSYRTVLERTLSNVRSKKRDIASLLLLNLMLLFFIVRPWFWIDIGSEFSMSDRLSFFYVVVFPLYLYITLIFSAKS